MSILKTNDWFSSEDQAMAAIKAAGYFPLTIDVPAETNEDHWHDFDSMIFILEGENRIIDATTGQMVTCGPGSRLDLSRGAIHREHHSGYRALFGFSVDPATFTGSLNLPPNPDKQV